MSLYDVLLIPFLFGLIGFVEPCSLGINVIFLNHIKRFSKAKRLAETILFTLIRGSILALVGLSAAYIGQQFITIQASLFSILGIIYFLLGVFLILGKYVPLPSLKTNFSHFFRNKKTISLGIIFGFVIPVCAIPLILALIGQAVVVQNLSAGFISLFVFGITLSLPLVALSLSEKSNQIIRWLSQKSKNVPFIAGIILIIFGILTVFSRSWWLGAL